MLSRSKFTTQVAEPYGMRMGGARALDPIDARDGFSKANPETFGPRALDAQKERLAAAKAQASAAAASSSSGKPCNCAAAPAADPSSLPLTDSGRVKSALPYVAAAVVVAIVAVRFLAR